MTTLNIVPECYADTRLVEILTESKKCNHQKNIGQVANEFLTRLKDISCLGIVDDDKKSIPKYFTEEFQVVTEVAGLKLHKHKERSQFLIYISPALESWLLTAASMVKLNPSDFGLDDEMQMLKSTTKSMHLAKNQDFTRFIKALVKKEAPSIILLKKWLMDFREGRL